MDKELVAIGYDENGSEVAEQYRCTKENCNCVGSWTNGNPEQVDIWEDVGEDENENV